MSAKQGSSKGEERVGQAKRGVNDSMIKEERCLRDRTTAGNRRWWKAVCQQERMKKMKNENKDVL